jgi:hypothetical protein
MRCASWTRAHAAGYLREIAELVRAAGTCLPEEWVDEQLHELKHEGPTAVLQEVKRLLQLHPQVAELEQKVSYLCKRERSMQYPRYQELGWPLGSGRVESANKGVVQARRVWGWHALGRLTCQSDVGGAHRHLFRPMGTSLARGLPAEAPAGRPVQAVPLPGAPSAAGSSCWLQDLPCAVPICCRACCLLHRFHRWASTGC